MLTCRVACQSGWSPHWWGSSGGPPEHGCSLYLPEHGVRERPAAPTSWRDSTSWRDPTSWRDVWTGRRPPGWWVASEQSAPSLSQVAGSAWARVRGCSLHALGALCGCRAAAQHSCAAEAGRRSCLSWARGRLEGWRAVGVAVERMSGVRRDEDTVNGARTRTCGGIRAPLVRLCRGRSGLACSPGENRSIASGGPLD